jgi:YD repeat-containing protein
VKRQAKRFLRSLLWLAIVGVCVTLLSTAIAQQGGTAKYTYDANGRLKSVLLPTGEMVIYDYDAAGNITAITRRIILSLTGFAPASGFVGTRITLAGTGFSTTPGDNTVKFNGAQANVISSTLTQLIVDVPAGATSGFITVSNANGSVTSSAPFIVVSAVAPTIISFSPTLGNAGTNVTINGANFDATAANNLLKFNGREAEVLAATSTSLSTTVPSGATSGHISVTTSGGTTESNGDFFVGSPGSVEITGRINVGESRTLSFTNGNDAILVFDGTAGQKVSATFTGVNLGDFLAALVAPDNSQLAFTSFEVSPLFIDAVTLPLTGTYTLVVSPRGFTGSATVNLFSVIDVSGAIAVDGAAMPLQISTPGQNAQFTFPASAGQRLTLRMTGVTIQGSNVAILDPDGAAIGFAFVNTSGGLIRTGVLPASGTYTILIDPFGKSVGNMMLTLATQPADATGSLTIGGASSVVTIHTPGQDAVVSFAAIAGQHLNLQLLPVTIANSSVSVLTPDGTEFVSATPVDSRGWFFDLPTLPASGTYKIKIVPDSDSIGSITLLLSVAVPTPILANGASVQLNITTPNQRPNLSFNGTAGQRVSLNVPGMTSLNRCTIQFFNPDATELSSTTIVRLNSIRFVDVQTLPTTGTYTIVITPQNPYETGNLTLALYDVAADISGTLTVGDPAVPVTITVPGQNAAFTFSATAGQQITVRLSGNTFSCVLVSLLKPDGTTQTSLTNCTGTFNLATQTLQTTGIYTVKIDPFGASTGSLNVNLTNP